MSIFVPNRKTEPKTAAAAAPVTKTKKTLTEADVRRIFSENPGLYKTMSRATNRVFESVQNNYSGDCQQQVANFVVTAGPEIVAFAALLSELNG